MAGVGEHRAVAHALEVLAAQHVGRAGDGDEDLAELGAAASALITSKPSIRASSARTGSTSQTITAAPAPFARCATPRPAEP